MRFLIDTNPDAVVQLANELPDLVAGQLVVANKGRRNWGGCFAMDNSAFIKFDCNKFRRMQQSHAAFKANCLFVACPDVVGNARRTLELWKRREVFASGFDLCLVAQDGIEDIEIPWDEMQSIFIGGKDPWKDSSACIDVVKTAKILGKHVHCGRVNQIKRYKTFAEVGCDTCDGSSIAIYKEKIYDIARELKSGDCPLFADS